MVVVKLQGGLGNQMFQYALGRRLSLGTGHELVLDLSFLEQKAPANYTLRDFELGVFDIIARLDRRGIYFKRDLISRLKTKLAGIKYIGEPDMGFQSEVLDPVTNVYLDGFWQTDQYFDDISKVIRGDFRLREAPDQPNQQTLDLIDSVNAVSIHVRRGDYISSSDTPTYHNLCDVRYYQDAVALLTQTVQNPVFFIFSDDISWVKTNLKLAYPHHYMVYNQGIRSFMDMQLMSHCRHHIIANSSFSWWGAWLNARTDKIVIAPKKWFNNSSINTKDITPATWIRL